MIGRGFPTPKESKMIDCGSPTLKDPKDPKDPEDPEKPKHKLTQDEIESFIRKDIKRNNLKDAMDKIEVYGASQEIIDTIIESLLQKKGDNNPAANWRKARDMAKIGASPKAIEAIIKKFIDEDLLKDAMEASLLREDKKENKEETETNTQEKTDLG